MTAEATKLLYGLNNTGALISSKPLLGGCVDLQRFWRGGLCGLFQGTVA
jgi:hypothetical protein